MLELKISDYKFYSNFYVSRKKNLYDRTHMFISKNEKIDKFLKYITSIYQTQPLFQDDTTQIKHFCYDYEFILTSDENYKDIVENRLIVPVYAPVTFKFTFPDKKELAKFKLLI